MAFRCAALLCALAGKKLFLVQRRELQVRRFPLFRACARRSCVPQRGVYACAVLYQWFSVLTPAGIWLGLEPPPRRGRLKGTTASRLYPDHFPGLAPVAPRCFVRCLARLRDGEVPLDRPSMTIGRFQHRGSGSLAAALRRPGGWSPLCSASAAICFPLRWIPYRSSC